ncbi:MAG: hypothetical protein ACE5EY_06425, partial [Anaerolineae bacterium]
VSGAPENMIVVDKLLTGFDEPRNRVLYIDKPLQEHGLLQAIARVNRLLEGKEHGLIVDYRGVLGELNQAMETYNALEGYDPEDVAGTVSDVSAEIEKLPISTMSSGICSKRWPIPTIWSRWSSSWSRRMCASVFTRR